jgi:hypothetical protein
MDGTTASECGLEPKEPSCQGKERLGKVPKVEHRCGVQVPRARLASTRLGNDLRGKGQMRDEI